MKRERIPLWLLTLLAMGYHPVSMAASCKTTQSYIGLEGINNQPGKSAWNLNQTAFRNNSAVNAYLFTGGNCTFTEKTSAKATGLVEYASFFRNPGRFEGKKNNGVAILKEGYVTYAPLSNLFIDVGKFRKNTGYLFSVNPLDLLRNTAGNARSIRTNVMGSRWRDVYDEGSTGIGMTLYQNSGTVDLVFFPRLVKNRSLQKSASEWNEWERTNDKDRFYASYSSTGLDSFNPTFSLLAGDYQALAFGTSGSLNDRVILSLESAIARGQRWRHLNMEDGKAIQALDSSIRAPYGLDKRKLSADLGISLRYTDDSRNEYGIEYYGQTQGYSRSEWKTYTDTAKFVNGGYADKLTSLGVVAEPWMVEGYRQYSNGMAAEFDNAARAGNRLGKHYATLYFNTNKEGLRELDWTASAVTNLVDKSTVLSLHVNTHLTQQIETYVGSSYSFGSERSEFGLFGEKGTLYAGMRVLW